jgi:hypothetical protein
MPLHDWTDDRGWDGVRHLWISQLLDWVRPRLPEGYRAYVGSVPLLTIDAPNGWPDLNVRSWGTPPSPAGRLRRDRPDQPGAGPGSHRHLHPRPPSWPCTWIGTAS